MNGEQRLAAALEALDFDKATSDMQRARLLFCLADFAESIGNVDLAAAATRRMPAADPVTAPPRWLAGFREGFQLHADEDRGTDPGNDHMSGVMLWQMSSDEWRRERVIDDFEQGSEDGRKEAEGQNNL